jgi:biopolymer transport protein ExbD
MGASVPGGGGKSANFELNLVPFIDLFSALICFLLMTAAWQNLEVVSTGTPPKAVDLRDENDEPQPEIKPEKPKVALAVTLYFDRLDIAEDSQVHSYPHISGAPDYQKLEATLADWHKRFPGRKDVLLSTENRAPYKYLIKLMDTFIAGEFPEVGITLN